MSAEREPYTVWSMFAPFRKDGAPVMGSFGQSVRSVVVMEAETFRRLIREHPELQTAVFRVGTVDDASSPVHPFPRAGAAGGGIL